MVDNASFLERLQDSLRQAASNLLSLKMTRVGDDPRVMQLLRELRSAIGDTVAVPEREPEEIKQEGNNYRMISRSARNKSAAARLSCERHCVELAEMQEVAIRAREFALKSQSRHPQLRR